MLEKEMATQSSTLAWEIPWTEKPGRLHCPWGGKELDTTEQLYLLTYRWWSRREKWWQNIAWRVERSSISFCFDDMFVRYMQYVYVLCDIYVYVCAYAYACMCVCLYMYIYIYKSSVLELEETLVQLSLHFTHKANEIQGQKWNIQCYTISFAWSINQEVLSPCLLETWNEPISQEKKKKKNLIPFLYVICYNEQT